jgi:hypothetical protein
MVSGASQGSAERKGDAVKKLLLALTILSFGAAAFMSARQATNRLQEQTGILRQALMAETQRLAAAQADQAGLAERGGELKRTLAVTRPAPENELWSALQTNRADRLPDKLRERLREEFGFTWESFKDYIVVSKETVGKLDVRFLESNGKLNDAAFTMLAITTEERSRVAAAIEQAQTNFKGWVLAHVQRIEPAEDVVARYNLAGDTKTARGITNDFFTAVVEAVGRQRMALLRAAAVKWMSEMGLSERSSSLTIKRQMVGDEPRFNVQLRENGRDRTADLPLKDGDFPKALRPLFPNGWADVAEREGIELPKESREK